MIKELLFCYKEGKKILIRNVILTDVFVPVKDIVSPQKTTFSLPKTNKIELSDIVIIRDNKSCVVEYIGYIDTIVNKTTTEISCYPLINIFDNDYVLDQIFETVEQEKRDEQGNVIANEFKKVDVEIDVVQWLKTQLTRAFIETDDNLQALPLIFRIHTKQPVFYKKIIETSNLFEVYLDLFINTGVYVLFTDVDYNMNEISGIYCDIYCNTDEKPCFLRYDFPTIQKVDIVDNTFTNYNKIIATESISEEDLEKDPSLKPQRYYFYLLNDNSITRDANDSRRIKQVRSKEITFERDKDKDDEENAKAMLLAVYNELQAPEYNLQITIDMFKKDEIKLYKRVDFLAESDIIYTSNVTKIEELNDMQIRITLGALRNSLTDFKKKVEAI